MEDLLEEVKKYDLIELRQKLNDHGIKIGPIAPTTKYLFQKRLASKLFELQGGKREDFEDEPSQPVVTKAPAEAVTPIKVKPPSNLDVYYAVCLPEEVSSTDEGEQLVFAVKDEALKAAKKYKGSRFKSFKSEKEALNFSRLRADSTFQSPKSVPKEDASSKETKPAAESSPYKAPKPQELAKLRKVIEAGDTAVFRDHVWNNPRYLVGSGDTPAIFQEGPRYTAMHVAALKNHAEMCQAILDILENPQFVNKLYCLSHNTIETQNSRINFLVDLYLNMPDKGSCESPLHMACKFGLEKVVEVLVAHPKTDRFLRNKWGDTPKDVICARCPAAASSLKQKIETLLQGQCYVPLIRSEDNCMPPLIGQPWSADVNKSPLDVPQKSWSPRDPSLSIKACAGPMSPSEADKFHKRWTTPPSQSPDLARNYFHTKRSDSEKGFERIGRQLALEMKVNWAENWEFLGTFADLSSPAGLEALEEYFQKKIWMTFIKQFKEKYDFTETSNDLSSCVTPVKVKPCDLDSNLSDSVFEKDEEKPKKADAVVEAGPEKQKAVIEDESKDKNTDTSVSDMVSPMTGLAMGFASMRLRDDSWSEHATVNTSLQSLDSSSDGSNDNLSSGSDEMSRGKPTCDESSKEDNENINKITISHKAYGKTEDSHEESKETGNDQTVNENKDDIDLGTCATEVKDENKYDLNTDHAKTTESSEIIDNLKDVKKITDNENDSEADIFKDCENNNVKSDVVANNNNKNTSKAETGSKVAVHIGEVSDTGKKSHNRTLSDSTESVTSFVTAAEDVEDARDAGVEDGDVFMVSLHIKAEIFDSLKEKLASGNREQVNTVDEELEESSTIEPHSTPEFLTRFRSLSDNSMRADIVYIPKRETVKEILMLEDVDVVLTQGDIERVEEGGIVGLKPVASESSSTAQADVLQSYLTRASSLPKCGFIYGPQPTREDLDVSRAVGKTILCPESYPNVFRWKISLSRFLKDTNYRWQSPAKMRPRLQQESPKRANTPVLTYKSPVSSGALSRSSSLTSDIRTKLFPTIGE